MLLTFHWFLNNHFKGERVQIADKNFPTEQKNGKGIKHIYLNVPFCDFLKYELNKKK